MKILRPNYLNKLISLKWNGQVKVITGVRRCGKSYLLFELFKDHLTSIGVKTEHILEFSFDDTRHLELRNPIIFERTISDLLSKNSASNYYLFIDEIQMMDEVENPHNPAGNRITFYEMLNGLKKNKNVDIYVTGSNSKMLSSDILTEFRGRSDEIRVFPLSFAEYYSVSSLDAKTAYKTYSIWGGMPSLIVLNSDSPKMEYLKSLFSNVYIKDIVERKKIEKIHILEYIVNYLCSTITSPVNITKISNYLQSELKIRISNNTIKSYVNHLVDSYLFGETKRYDIKGKKYFDAPYKYYVVDIGLRNSRLGFSQLEPTHAMENIIYNELVMRGYSVDVGATHVREKNKNGDYADKLCEVDFVVSNGNRKIYIQSAYAINDEDKLRIEKRPFRNINDSNQRILIRNDIDNRWVDDEGVLNISLIDFLLDETVLSIYESASVMSTEEISVRIYSFYYGTVIDDIDEEYHTPNFRISNLVSEENVERFLLYCVAHEEDFVFFKEIDLAPIMRMCGIDAYYFKKVSKTSFKSYVEAWKYVYNSRNYGNISGFIKYSTALLNEMIYDPDEPPF